METRHFFKLLLFNKLCAGFAHCAVFMSLSFQQIISFRNKRSVKCLSVFLKYIYCRSFFLFLTITEQHKYCSFLEVDLAAVMLVWLWNFLFDIISLLAFVLVGSVYCSLGQKDVKIITFQKNYANFIPMPATSNNALLLWYFHFQEILNFKYREVIFLLIAIA